jgi:hypothetical protein
MMLTFRAGKFAALIVSVALLSACSREQQDWRSAEASDTVEGYGEFLHRHPDSELATEARTRVEQLSEDREWQSVGAADTADAYKQFLAQHPNGKWAQEARIRVENFALGREGAAAAPGVSGAVSAEGAGGVTVSAASPTPGSTASSTGSAASGYGAGATSGAASSPAIGSAWTGSGNSAAQAFPAESARGSASPGDPARPSPPVAATNTPTPTQLASATPVSPGDLARPPSPTQVSPAGSAEASPAIAGAWRSDDGFGVQLGAFASENAATTEWQQLTTRFSAQLRGLAPRVISANTSTGRLFRLQALVADEAAARALCDMLRKQSQACVPVLPH